MALINGKSCAYTFDGTTVGQLISISWDGMTSPVTISKYIGAAAVTKTATDIPDYGTQVVTVDYDPADAGHIKLDAAFTSGTAYNAVLTLNPGSTTKTVSAIVTDRNITNIQAGGVAQAQYTLACSGAIS